MSSLSGENPTERFTGLATTYAKWRPSYPASALDYIVAKCGLGVGSLLVDVGCGTGISSRLFAERGVSVIGIEPNTDMRAQAEQVPADLPSPSYRHGTAEATGLSDQVADVVLAAQAFHWFEPGAALTEFYRILKSGGWVVLMWNERDESDPITAAYGKVVRSTPEAASLEQIRSRAGDALFTHPLFIDSERVSFHNQQDLDEAGLLGRALSVSYKPKAPEQVAAYEEAVRAVFARYQENGLVWLHYETSVYLARRIVSNLVTDARSCYF